MKKKKKKPTLTPKDKKDQQKGLDALKDKNFHLDDDENDKVSGGFIEFGGSEGNGPGNGSDKDGDKHHPGKHGGHHHCD